MQEGQQADEQDDKYAVIWYALPVGTGEQFGRFAFKCKAEETAGGAVDIAVAGGEGGG